MKFTHKIGNNVPKLPGTHPPVICKTYRIGSRLFNLQKERFHGSLYRQRLPPPSTSHVSCGECCNPLFFTPPLITKSQEEEIHSIQNIANVNLLNIDVPKMVCKKRLQLTLAGSPELKHLMRLLPSMNIRHFDS